MEFGIGHSGFIWPFVVKVRRAVIELRAAHEAVASVVKENLADGFVGVDHCADAFFEVSGVAVEDYLNTIESARSSEQFSHRLNVRLAALKSIEQFIVGVADQDRYVCQWILPNNLNRDPSRKLASARQILDQISIVIDLTGPADRVARVAGFFLKNCGGEPKPEPLAA